ncbi:MAG: helix-turn-helix domain-containing protein [Myxococcota bacterium]|nr:helix-turn-helix domain-containing protein [Myxococcota bacterium]
MATQAERREQTREQLLRAASRLFGRNGIPETTTQAVLEEAGLSRGALYHHFDSREELVAAVYERESAAAIERALSRASGPDGSLESLLSACLAWLDEVAKPRVARILLEGGPSELGFLRCREIEARHSLGRMAASLDAAARAGEIELVEKSLVARMLNALLTEAALAIAEAPSPREARRARADAESALRQLVSGLRR